MKKVILHLAFLLLSILSFGQQNEIFINPSSPTECEDVTITVTGAFTNGCEFLGSISYQIIGTAIVVDVVIGNTGDPFCTALFLPWEEDVIIPAGQLNTGTYNVTYILNSLPVAFENFDVTACPTIGSINVNPLEPTECENVTLTVASQFNNGCEFLNSLQYNILGNTVTVIATIGTNPGPCTQVITPWEQDIILSPGELAQGSYTAIFIIDGIVVDEVGFNVVDCPQSGAISINPTEPTECEDVVITVSSQFNNGCEFLSGLQQIVSGNTITVIATIGSTPGPCTQVITPWQEDIIISAGELAQGFYTVTFIINGTVVDDAGFNVFECTILGTIEVSPINPTECGDITLTVSSQFNNGCEFLNSLQYNIIGNTITVTATIGSTPGPCTQVIIPWEQDIILSAGELTQGSYTATFIIDGVVVDDISFTVAECPVVGDISVSPTNPTECGDITLTVSSQFNNGCEELTSLQPVISGNNISIIATVITNPGPCTQAIIPWQEDVIFSPGELPPGTYMASFVINGTTVDEVTFTVAGCPVIGDISVSPTNPTECGDVTLTVSSQFNNGCEELTSLQPVISGNNISIIATVITNPGPCTQAIIPWQEDLVFSSGSLTQGTYTASFVINGVTVDEVTFTVVECPVIGDISINPTNPTVCEEIVVTVSSQFNNGCEELVSLQPIISGNNISIIATVITNPGPCTQAIIPWQEEVTFSSGELPQGTYMISFIINGLIVDMVNLTIAAGPMEICNGLDDDCDGLIDEGVLLTFYLDSDNDGFGDFESPTMACSAPFGYVDNSGDCNDTNPDINPAASEACNGIDDNCNNQVDEGLALNTYYADTDSDGFGDLGNSVMVCSAPFGYVDNSGDCDDTNPDINPAASEACNGIDDNCNNQVDEGLALNTYYADDDNDGFGDPSNSILDCSAIAPPGYVVGGGDCDDTDPDINPTAIEIPGNGIDENCDGLDLVVDDDGDGFTTITDCDDDDPAINPAAVEIPGNGIDENCDGLDGPIATDELTFVAGHLSGSQGDIVEIPVYVLNFEDVVGFQFTLHLPETGIGNILGINSTSMIPGVIANNLLDTETLTLLWNAPQTIPVTIPDSTIIFYVQIELVGDIGSCSILDFTNTPTDLFASIFEPSNGIVPFTFYGSYCINSTFSVSGLIKTELGTGVNNVEVACLPTSYNDVTGLDGLYEISDLPAGGDYEIVPRKDTLSANGLNVADVAMIQQHILAVQPLSSPYKIIAADVDDSGGLNVTDILLVQQVILNVIPAFPDIDSWRFVPAEYEFIDPSNPLSENFPETLEFSELDSNVTEAGFIGIKVGDVDCSADPSLFSQNGGTTFLLPGQAFEAGELIQVPIYATGFDGLAGFQFEFVFDPETLEFQNIQSVGLQGINGNNYSTLALSEGRLPFLWHDQTVNMEGLKFEPNEVLFYLDFYCLKSGNLEGEIGVALENAMTVSPAGEKAILDFAFVGNILADEISISPESPTECEEITVTISSEFTDGCQFINSIQTDVSNDSINLVVDIGSTPGPCPQVIIPWQEDIVIPAGELASGAYTATIIKDSLATSSLEFNVAECSTSTVFEGHEKLVLSIFPNPFSEDCIIQIQSKESLEIQLQVFSSTGQVVSNMHKRVNRGLSNITLPNVIFGEDGIYFYRMNTPVGDFSGTLIYSR